MATFHAVHPLWVRVTGSPEARFCDVGEQLPANAFPADLEHLLTHGTIRAHVVEASAVPVEGAAEPKRKPRKASAGE